MEPPLALLLRSHVQRALKCTDFVNGVVGRSHALARPLQLARHRSVGPSLRSSCVVSAVDSTTPHSDSLRAAPDFGTALYRGSLPRRSISPSGAGGSPQLTNRPSLHAASFTPERFQAAPESTAWTAAFAHNSRARPARSLTRACFDAVEFIFIAACSYAPPRFDARLSPDAGELASGLLWRFARAGLSPAGRLALLWALGLSKLCASRAAYPRRFARRCGFRWWRSPPLRAGHRREQGCRIPDTTHPGLPLRKTSCRIRSGGRLRTGRRIGRTRRSCDRRVLCGAEVPYAQASNRRWGFDGGAGNRVAGELAHSTSRET